MLTKLTITKSEAEELRQSLHNWRQSDLDRSLWLARIADDLGCDTDYAVDIANGNEGVCNLLDRLCIDVVADDEPDVKIAMDDRWIITLEERIENVILLMLGCGLAAVIGWSIYLGINGWWE